MNLFNTRENNDYVMIGDKPSGYNLIFSKEIKAFRFENVFFTANMRGTDIVITGRDMDEYVPSIKRLPINSKYQYLEIGAGLGELVPHLVKSGYGIKRPIIIDPVNYDLILSMLLYASKKGFDDYRTGRINTFIERAEIILNPAKVILINTTLGDSLDKHPDLAGIGDVVIDHYGPNYYEDTEPKKSGDNLIHIRSLEKRLCKEGGLMIRA